MIPYYLFLIKAVYVVDAIIFLWFVRSKFSVFFSKAQIK